METHQSAIKQFRASLRASLDKGERFDLDGMEYILAYQGEEIAYQDNGTEMVADTLGSGVYTFAKVYRGPDMSTPKGERPIFYCGSDDFIFQAVENIKNLPVNEIVDKATYLSLGRFDVNAAMRNIPGPG